MLIAALLFQPANAAESSDSLSTKPKKSHLHRNLAIGNALGLSAAYVYWTNTWGEPDGSFHFKDDLNDNLAMNDEFSHLFASYQLAEGFAWLFRLLQMDSTKVEKYALLEAALVTTLVEFPLDAFNPDQGFGVSDLLFNGAGLGLYWFRHHVSDRFDVKFSLRKAPWKFENKFLASENKEFANFIWWAVYKPRYAWVGLGYGIEHEQRLVDAEYYLGVGTTLYDLLKIVTPGLAKRLKALDTFFISLHVRL